uniref:Uncharacterized protein n=1 Tax=Human herpesvirus 2 TaxID=10310 RepID=A0A481TWJ9_HHV2|nr:hypothetical protein [Human alphaherpesvirus 2]
MLGQKRGRGGERRENKTRKKKQHTEPHSVLVRGLLLAATGTQKSAAIF